ncbi:hypothetical protein NIES4075_35390 [Tolypothrix sp. NIES-4075]|nr:hypothetical protein NIES4075_35390 [Tolypothrix sp. NIES-4075]
MGKKALPRFQLPIPNSQLPLRGSRLCFSDAETLREQVARPFQQSLMGVTNMTALLHQRTGSPITYSQLPIFDYTRNIMVSNPC